MSWAASAWAKRQDTKTSGAKLVLMILADYASTIEGHEPASAEGRHYAWPGITRLAADCLMTERTVITHLAKLEELDLIRRERRADRDGKRVSDYLILPVDDSGDSPWITDQTGVYVDQVQNLHVKEKEGLCEKNADASYRASNEPQTTKKRATRLPEDFKVTDEMRDWYRKNIGNSINGLSEHEKFLDYWRAQSGNRGVKADWPATWRNWMRNAMERAGARPTSGAGVGATSKPRYPTAAERSHDRLMSERDLLLQAEAIVEQMGGNPEKDHAKVTEVYNRLVATGRSGSATRTSDMYSDKQWIEGEIVGPKEVTAGEGQ